MKMNNFLVMFFSLLLSTAVVFALQAYAYSKEKNGEIQVLAEELVAYQIQARTFNSKIEEMNSYILFMEQSIPDINKRNSKAKAVKEIVNSAIKNTKQNFFKSEREYNDYILSVVDYSEKYRVPVSLILAVSRQESNFNPRAVSSTNAQGVMQLIPSTSKFCADSLKKEQHDPFYVRDSVQCGTWYLRQMLDMFKDEELVIKAYNVGPTYVIKYKGADLPEETVDYHEKVSGFIAEYRPKLRWEN